ncbi:sugar ABC transporter ATP-binding protein [Faecalicatena contorta]|uniref:sugar ABC transporter ATP-binding protein n=1 Tax=Faecalicatena contorta TaxID=39482 RepID=UPI003217FF97
MAKILLEMRGICKSFNGVPALQDVDFIVKEGEIHALMGENGAGKSTLIKILTGIYTKDKGEILFDGKPLVAKNALVVQKAGISTIYQESNLIPELSIAENIFMGREIKKRGQINWRETLRQAKEILNGFGLDIDVTQPVGRLGAALQQITSIARAISIDAKLVVMDEPTSSLDEKEVGILVNVIHKLQERNIAIIFISHRLNEVFDVCKTTTVLKDGNLVGRYSLSELNEQKLVSLMIGREYQESKRVNVKNIEGHPEMIRVEAVCAVPKVYDVSFLIKSGECIGLAGLLGSGRTECAGLLFGIRHPDKGKIFVKGEEIKIKNPKHAISKKIAYLSEERKRDGIIPNMSVRENITLCMLPQVSKFGVISSEKEKDIVNTYIKRLNIKTASMEKKVRQLSGGNQQKVLIARWLATNPELIILDEPTRGIDVGAKGEIEELISEMTDKGISVLMISSEMSEMIRSCSRIEVLRDGILVGELAGNELSEDRIIETITKKNRKEAARGHDR